MFVVIQTRVNCGNKRVVGLAETFRQACRQALEQCDELCLDVPGRSIEKVADSAFELFQDGNRFAYVQVFACSPIIDNVQ